MDQNEVRLRGNLGADPKLFEEPGQTAFAVFDMATNIKFRSSKNEVTERTEWHHVVCFDWRVNIAKTFKRGTHVQVDGYLRTRKIARGDGTEVDATEVVATDLFEVRRAPKAEQAPAPATTSSGTGAPAPGQPVFA